MGNQIRVWIWFPALANAYGAKPNRALGFSRRNMLRREKPIRSTGHQRSSIDRRNASEVEAAVLREETEWAMEQELEMCPPPAPMPQQQQPQPRRMVPPPPPPPAPYLLEL